MRIILLRSVKCTGVLLLLFALYLLVGSTVPYMRKKTVSPENKAALDGVVFTAETESADRVVLLEEAADAFNARLCAIREASETLDIVSYTVHSGTCCDIFFREVLRAADRGVQVRILIDGTANLPDKAARTLLQRLAAHERIEFRLYNPVNLLKPWKIHAVLHDKYLLADGQIVIMGGRNIGDRFFLPEGYDGAGVADRDVLVYRSDAAADSVLDAVYDYLHALWTLPESKAQKAIQTENSAAEAWCLAAEAALARNASFERYTWTAYQARSLPAAKITLIHNPLNAGKKEPWVGYQMRRLAQKVETAVVLQSPYATANKALLAAMTETADRVPVTYLTNSMAASPNPWAFSNYYYNREKFIQTGAALYEAQAVQSIHGKSMLVDGRISAVGTMNMDDRSLYIDTESMLVIDSPAFAAVLGDALAEIRGVSLRVGEDNTYIADDAVQALHLPDKKRRKMARYSIVSRLFQPLI